MQELSDVRRVWRYQKGNQNPYIEEEQTTQWPKEKVQKDKQRSTKHTHKTKDRVTRTPIETRCELRCSGRVSISCSTSGTRRVTNDPVSVKPRCKSIECCCFYVIITCEQFVVFYVIATRELFLLFSVNKYSELFAAVQILSLPVGPLIGLLVDWKRKQSFGMLSIYVNEYKAVS